MHPDPLSITTRAALFVDQEQAAWQKRPQNLWTLSLAPPTELTIAVDATRRRTAISPEDHDMQDLAARMALAHSIRFPIKTAAGVNQATCPHCSFRNDNPQALDDDHFHLQSCRYNTNTQRHDSLVRNIVLITRAAGIDTATHDDALPYLPCSKRPADLIERTNVPADRDL